MLSSLGQGRGLGGMGVFRQAEHESLANTDIVKGGKAITLLCQFA
ncbi:hypothetical protein [Pseudoalteromonas sp. OOF1S-7]|nr:hypothetical protein [Pseudoalteromonas sp. OOF1S-7]